MNTAPPGGLPGKLHIFIVEDEPIIASMLEAILAELGYESATAYDLQSAVGVIRNTNIQIDAAIVDVMLHGKPGYVLCHALTARRVPFALCTGVYERAIEAPWNELLNIGKPFTGKGVAAALTYLLSDTYQSGR